MSLLLHCTIEKLIQGGRGLARITSEGLSPSIPPSWVGRIVMVSGGVLPGETVLCNLPEMLSLSPKKAIEASLVEVMTPSTLRTTPVCAVHKLCGGCDWQHITPEAQGIEKAAVFQETLKHLGGFASQEALLPVLTTTPWHYRRHYQWHVCHPKTPLEKVTLGFKQRGSHEGIAYAHCHVLPQGAERLYTSLVQWLQTLPLTTQRLLHTVDVLWEASPESVPTIAIGCLSTQTTPFKGWHTCMTQLAQHLQKVSITLTGAYWHTSRHTCSPHTWGDTTFQRSIVWHDTHTTPTSHETKPHTLTISHQLHQFFQVHPQGLTHMLETLTRWYHQWQAMESFQSPSHVLYDVYAGVGVFGRWWLEMQQATGNLTTTHVVGVEANQQSAIMAKKNWQLPEGTSPASTHFIAMPIEKALPLIQKQKKLPTPHVMVLDPPRAGLGETVKTWLLNPPRSLQHVVLISCDTATLARDLKVLLQGEPSPWVIQAIQPIDMFPQTHHLEAMVWLTRKP
ncbi:MAG: class I SAM-dependent RNA methyltransferase [Vampirovibrionales bacterium]